MTPVRKRKQASSMVDVDLSINTKYSIDLSIYHA